MLQSIGRMFLVAGVYASGRTCLDLYGRARRRRRLLEKPQEPWMADHAWTRDGVTSDDLRQALEFVGFAIFLKVFLGPFEYLAFSGGVGAWIWMSGVALFHACAVWMLARAAHVLIRRWLYGVPRIRFEQFPMFLGQRMRVRLECSRALRRCRSLRLNLRCIQESYISSDSDSDGNSTLCHAHYTECRELPAESWRSDPVTIEMDLPANELPSALWERPPRYWTLTLHGDAPWLDFYAVFLLPVYGPSTSRG
jgi:hypothetical protein